LIGARNAVIDGILFHRIRPFRTIGQSRSIPQSFCIETFLQAIAQSRHRKTMTSLLYVTFLTASAAALAFAPDVDKVMSPAVQHCVLFVLLRLLAINGMQYLFFGNSIVRRMFPATIDTRDYDEGQYKRERVTWPSVVFGGLFKYAVFKSGRMKDPSEMEFCSKSSVLLLVLTHATLVEFIYYWAHRLLHWPSFYTVHKHHHLSIVPTPKTSVTFLWSEHLLYDILFSLAPMVVNRLGETTVAVSLFYIPIFDILNMLGHTNLEVFPKWYMNSPFYYFFYCSTFHNVHHKYFKYNFALFMPIYDIVFGTYNREYTEKDFYGAHQRAEKSKKVE
jgi:sterol desaturase/sphingolipid hydroxylase (fatty acid hydroxylase superfamily)